MSTLATPRTDPNSDAARAAALNLTPRLYRVFSAILMAEKCGFHPNFAFVETNCGPSARTAVTSLGQRGWIDVTVDGSLVTLRDGAGRLRERRTSP